MKRQRETLMEMVDREQRALARREWWITAALLVGVVGWWLYLVWRGFTLATGGAQ